jgi:hypothetical protein
MKSIEFEEGAIQIDATIVAEGLGIPPLLFMDLLQDGKITSLCERGVDVDNGRHRLTFFSEQRRLRLIVDDSGVIIRHSIIDFGKPRRPASARGPVSGERRG